MDLIIAAAGKGTRLGVHTQDTPKHIITIGARPFLYYLLDAIAEAKYRRIIVVGGYFFEKLQAAMEEYAEQNPDGPEIIVINQFTELGEEMYGTACPLLAAQPYIQGDRFVYTMGDQLVSARDLEQMQKSSVETIVAGYEHNTPERYGVIEYSQPPYLKRIVEKPKRPPSNKINVALYSLNQKIFGRLKRVKSSSRGEYEITDAINMLAKEEPVLVSTLQDHWLDLGRPEDIVALEQFVASSNSSELAVWKKLLLLEGDLANPSYYFIWRSMILRYRLLYPWWITVDLLGYYEINCKCCHQAMCGGVLRL